MNNRRLIITSLVSIILVCVLFIGNTFSILSVVEVDENINYYTTGNLDITYEVSDKEVVLNNSYPLKYEDAMKLDPYRITVYNKGNIDYEFRLLLLDETETNSIDYKYINVQVGNNDFISFDSVTDGIIKDRIVIKGGDSVDIDIFVWIDENISNSEIGKGFYAKVAIDGFAISNGVSSNQNLIYNLDASGANKPVLDGNMIPVYYDNENDIWRKADVSNRNASYKWYDYDDKMWANSVLVKSETYDNYMNDNYIGKEVKLEDIIAFYVWIPRYKYRVFNINRSSTSYDSYVDIRFENNTNSTGNVSCSYNYSNDNELILSDNCYYNNNIVNSSDDNNNYKDAWYTHPAFTYDGEDVTGFWVGKFETSGTSDKPLIVPDSVSLRNQTFLEQFETSKLFNNYELENMESRLLRNLEWGALVYLTNSVYGLCDVVSKDVVCSNIYNNNSSLYYTGSGSNNNDEISNYGTYNYQGYLIISSSKDRSLDKTVKNEIIASSTLNIYGVYDLAGGAIERVMGVSKELENIDKKYYDLYINGNISGYNYRSKLGDATIEYNINNNYFIYDDYYVFVRGNLFDTSSNIFSYGASNEDENNNYTFRSVIS